MTAQRIQGYQPGSGLAESDAALAELGKMFGGYVPNFHRVLAHSPAVISAFQKMRATLQKTKLRAAEREIVALEVSRRSACEYCIAAHSKGARLHRVAEPDVAAAVAGTPLEDARLALVQRATQRLWDTRGRLSDHELAELQNAGLSAAELLEIIAVIGWYVWSTLTNNLAHTEIDEFWR